MSISNGGDGDGGADGPKTEEMHIAMLFKRKIKE